MHFPENAQVAFLVMSDVFLALLELEDWLCDLNPHPKEVVKGADDVPLPATAIVGNKFQFERLGNL